MLQDLLVIAGMFFLRLGLPVIAMFAVGYALERALGYAREDRVTLPHGEPIPVEGDAPAGRPVPAWTLMPCATRVRRAYHRLDRPALPCWLALNLAEGRLSDQCLGCQWYRPRVEAQPVSTVTKGERGERNL